MTTILERSIIYFRKCGMWYIVLIINNLYNQSNFRVLNVFFYFNRYPVMNSCVRLAICGNSVVKRIPHYLHQSSINLKHHCARFSRNTAINCTTQVNLVTFLKTTQNKIFFVISLIRGVVTLGTKL